MNLDYDDLPGRAAATFDYHVEVPPDLAKRSLQTGRRVRRRRRVLAGAGSLAAVALVAIAVPALVPTHRAGSQQIGVAGIAPASPAVSLAPAVAASETEPAALATAKAASASVTVAPSDNASPGPSTMAQYASPGASEPVSVAELPTHFIAAIGAGSERATVVDTATGARGRVLTAGSQALDVVSDDGTTLWEPVGDTLTWQAVDVATGAVTAAPRFTGDRQFAISPTDDTLAAWDGHGTLRVGSATVAVSSAPDAQWAADGNHLVIQTATGVEVLDRSLAVTAMMKPSDSLSCDYAAPHFSGTKTLVVAENCASDGRFSILDLDSVSGKQLSSSVLVSGASRDSTIGVTSMDVDAAGDAIAVLTMNTPKSDGVVYTVTADGHVTREGTTDTYQVNWLPRVAKPSS